MVYSIIVLLLAPALALVLTTQVEPVAASPNGTVENLWVDSYDVRIQEWIVSGTSPYLDAVDTNHVSATAFKQEIGDFHFSDLSFSVAINSVTLNVRGIADGGETLRVYLWDGSSWVVSYDFSVGAGHQWYSENVTSYLDTYTKVNSAKIYLESDKSGAWTGPVKANAAYLSVDYIIPPPEKPVLLEPENNITTADTTPTFYWTAGTYAENHRIEIDNEISFAQPLVENDNVVGTSWTPNTGLSTGTYHWRVWAINEAGDNVSEDTWEFTITTWWDIDWGNRRKIEISPLNSENYQIKIVFDNLGNMKSDLSDLRFLENAVSDEPLPHWVENYTADNATVWVRRRENTDNSIYAYYANPSASSVENFDNVWFDLIAWWEMDEGTGDNVFDITPNTYDGIRNNFTNGWVDGKFENALDFDGTNDFVKVAAMPEIGTSSMTWSMWIKTESTADEQILNQYPSGEGCYVWCLSSGKVRLNVKDDPNELDSGTFDSTSTVNDNAWHFLTFVWNQSTDKGYIYIDGTLDATSAANADIVDVNNPGNFYMGCNEGEIVNFDGIIDDFMVHNRVLENAEIEKLALTTRPSAIVGEQEPPPVLPTKPVLYSPSDSSTITDETPTFEWTKGKNADYHKLLVSSDNTFTSIVENENIIVKNYYTIPADNFLSDGKYWWKVSALSENGENTSDTWSFTVKAISVFEASSGVDEIWRYKDVNGAEMFRVAMSENGNYLAVATYGGYLRYFSRDENVPKWSKSYGADVRNVAMSDNGQWIAASTGSTLYFYDNEGNENWSYSHASTIVKDTVDMSGDGKWVTCGSGYVGEKAIVVLKGIGGDGNYTWKYNPTGRTRGIAISDSPVDGKYRIVSVSEDDYIRFFENDDNDVIWSYHWENAGTFKAQSVAISNSGNYIFAGATDNNVYLFDNDDNNYLWRYEFTDNTYWADQHIWFPVSISGDGQYMFGGINSLEGWYISWSKDDNNPLWIMRDQEARDVKISGDGSRMVGAGWSGRFLSWNRDDNIPIWNFADIAIRPDDTAISENGSLVAGIGSDTLYLLQDGSSAYDLKTEKQIRPYRVLTTTPEFSFKLPSRKVENTVAFRIVVGENVLDVDNLMWNSTWDIENEENAVYRTYAGSTLSPYVNYQWRVRLKDNENNWSPWSVTRSFEIVELLGFDNYRTITFTEDIPDNYQVKVVIPPTPNVDENLKDLLFYDSSYPNVGLPYWIENMDENIVWVKVHDNNPIKLCYGNDNVGDASYGDDVFPDLFDNFAGTSVDFTRWTTYGTPSVSSGIVSLTGDERLWTKDMHGVNLTLRVRANIASSTDNQYIGFSKNEPKGGVGAQIPTALFWGKEVNTLHLRTGKVAYLLDGTGGGIATDNSASVDYLGNYIIYELKRVGTDNVELWANDDNLVLANSTNIASAPVPIYIQTKTTDGTLYVDWIFLRKSLAVEPTVTVGGEESWGWEEIEEWSGAVEAPVAWNLMEEWSGTVRAPSVWTLVETWDGTVDAVAQWDLVEEWSGTVQSPSAWSLIETWDGTIDAPAEWGLIEEWSGTVQAPTAWLLMETWSGTVEAPSEWGLIETWSGVIATPAGWTLIEQWDGTIIAPVAWELIESWDGTVEAFSGWQLVEEWSGIIEAYTEWTLIEEWTGTVENPAVWDLIETWTATIKAPAEWQLTETWDGDVQAPSAWDLVETWTGTIQAPTAWNLIESWSGAVLAYVEWQQIESWAGTIQAPTEWSLLETWTGTVESPTAWQLISTWSGTIQTPSVWDLIETWTGTVQAPSEWSEVESWDGTVIAVGWVLIETWSGTVQTETIAAWNLIESWTGEIRTLAVYMVSVTITPAENSGTLGSTLTYTVTVVNIGGISDNYNLTSSDSQGWPVYLDDSAILNVASSASESTTLNVGLSTLGTHTINVTATSQGDGAVSDTASTTAISAAAGTIVGGGDASLALAVAMLALGLVFSLPFVLLIRRRREERREGGVVT